MSRATLNSGSVGAAKTVFRRAARETKRRRAERRFAFARKPFL
jgi:hypothetical protein